jgi:DNA-binding MarR family transcriptional regulator
MGEDHAEKFPAAVVLGTIRSGHLAERVIATILRPHDLTPAAFNVLSVLRDSARPLCPSTLGERLHVTRGTMTGVIDSLEKRGHVLRIPHPDDGRMTLIALTDLGAELVEEIKPLLERFAPGLLPTVSGDDLGEFLTLLGRIEADLDRWILDHLSA